MTKVRVQAFCMPSGAICTHISKSHRSVTNRCDLVDFLIFLQPFKGSSGLEIADEGKEWSMRRCKHLQNMAEAANTKPSPTLDTPG